jgi:uncharacterized membrane protein YtjA (UPF0391 family)
VGHVLQVAAPASDCAADGIPGNFAQSDAVRNINLLTTRGAIMLHYAAVFFVIALIAAVFGFGGIAVGAAGIAKILFIVFLIGAVITFLMSMGRRV